MNNSNRHGGWLSVSAHVAASSLCVGMAMMSSAAIVAPDITVKYISLPESCCNTLNLSLSADGRYAAYRIGNATSPSVVNIFIHDLVTGTRTQANLMPNGSAPTAAQCDTPAISADARYVVFACVSASMGVYVPLSGSAYFVYDRIANKTEVVPSAPGDNINRAIAAAISADGHYVAYRTLSNASGYETLFIRDMVNKTTQTTNAQQVSPGLTPANINISNDGRYVSYHGRITPTSGIRGVFSYDNVAAATEVVNVSSAGVRGTKDATYPSMSADGNVIAFLSNDVALTTPAARVGGVFVRDRRAGTTTLISAGATYGFANYPALSPNGRYVAYTGNPNQGTKNLYVYDRLTKITRAIPGAIDSTRTSVYPAFSADGRYLAFESVSFRNPTKVIGLADLGAAAGLSLSAAPQALTEGGAAGTYSVALTRVPDANVTVTVAPDSRLSVARTQLTFTPENWNVPQVISVQALQDNIVEGAHSGTVTHAVTSSDVNYTVIPTSSVTVPITDAVVPTIILPGTPWHQSTLPLTGVASPGATVLLTATSRATGALASVSVLVDAKGNWSYTLTGLTDGTYDLDTQADGINGAIKTVTISLLPTFTDVTSSITTTAYGLVFNRSTGKYAGNFVLTNSGGTALTAPLQLEFDNLTAGATLASASGSHAGAPFITLPGGLAPGASVTVPLLFNNPAKGAINYSARTFTGSF